MVADVSSIGLLIVLKFLSDYHAAIDQNTIEKKELKELRKQKYFLYINIILLQ